MDKEGRRGRVVENKEQLLHFVKRLIAKCDAAATEGKRMPLVVDLEGDYVSPGVDRKPDPFFLHRYKLQCEGATAEAIRARVERQRQMTLDWAKLTPGEKKRQKSAYEQNRRDFGMVETDIFALTLGCADGSGGELVCVWHMTKLVESLGLEGFPQEVGQLFKHPAGEWYNAGVEGDLTKINSAFFNGELEGVKFVELRSLAEKEFGKPLPKRDDVAGEGLLGIFERVFPGRTWPKWPFLTRSHWWAPEWDDDQVSYASVDVFGAIMSVGELRRHV